MREDTRLSPLFCTASDKNLGGAWKRGYWSWYLWFLSVSNSHWLQNIYVTHMTLNKSDASESITW